MKRKEIENILEKTCYWFKIDSKPNFFIEQPPPPPLAEFSYDEEKLKVMGKYFGKKQKHKKAERSPEIIELEKVCMDEIDRCFKKIKAQKNFGGEDLNESYIAKTKNQNNKLVGELDCRVC